MDFFNKTVSPRLKLDKESFPEIRFIHISKNNLGFHGLRLVCSVRLLVVTTFTVYVP